jgi:hypothetical protein
VNGVGIFSCVEFISFNEYLSARLTGVINPQWSDELGLRLRHVHIPALDLSPSMNTCQRSTTEKSAGR